MDLNKPDRDRMAWIAMAACVFVSALFIAIAQWGCVGVDPSASMGDSTITPRLTAGDIETAVQTAINSNASIVNDLWPIVAMLFIAVAGLVLVKRFNTVQTQEVKDHVDKCNSH